MINTHAAHGAIAICTRERLLVSPSNQVVALWIARNRVTSVPKDNRPHTSHAPTKTASPSPLDIGTREGSLSDFGRRKHFPSGVRRAYTRASLSEIRELRFRSVIVAETHNVPYSAYEEHVRLYYLSCGRCVYSTPTHGAPEDEAK